MWSMRRPPKIVPTAEYNPFECVKTNINGAMNVIDACIDTTVQSCVSRYPLIKQVVQSIFMELPNWRQTNFLLRLMHTLKSMLKILSGSLWQCYGLKRFGHSIF